VTLTTKEKVLNLLKNYDRLLMENHAFRCMLSTANDARVRDTWERTLEEVLNKRMLAQSSRPNSPHYTLKFPLISIR
jgi:hypothetical protein